MFNEHFSFKFTPFERNIDVKYLYESSQFSEALARLVYACQRRDMAVLTGEIGSGKSTLLRMLKHSLDEHQSIFIYIADSQLTPRNFYALALTQLGMNPPGQLTKLKHTFKSVLAELFESRRKTCIIAIDEAQTLSLSMIQELRFIMNFDVDSYSPLGLILSGQPEFRPTLRSPLMIPIWRRVETHYHLSGMSEKETREYIEHQLASAGCERPLFPDEVVRKIHEHSRGISATINTLCKGCLLDAAMRKQNLVDSQNLERVLAERN